MSSYKLDLVVLTPRSIGQVRVLNTHLFPVRYKDSFYEQLLANADLGRLGYFADCLVATIGCKIQSKRLYIMTLGVLENYRRFGFGSQLLGWAIEQGNKHCLSEIALHVHVDNIAAIEFYSKNGFVVHHTDNDYYPQLVPCSAHFLVKKL